MSLPLLGSGPGAGGAGGTSSEVSQFLSRTSGLDGTHVSAYTALINGMVTDSIWTKFDVLHIYATQNATTAQINLISSSYPATVNGSPTFTTDRGYQGTESSTTVYINTGFNPSTAGSPKYTANSAHLSSWQVTNATGTASVGASDGSNSYPIPRLAGNLFYCRVSDSPGGSESVANSDSRGHFIVNRSGLSTEQGYINGSLTHSPNKTRSNPVTNLNFYSIGWNSGGTANGYGQQEAMISIGSSLSGTDATNFYNRLRTYMTAVGVP